MNKPNGRTPFDACKALVRKGEWTAGLAAYADAVRAGAVPDEAARVYRAIAQIRVGENGAAAIEALDASLIRAADARIDVKRLVVSPLIRDGALHDAAAVLGALVNAWPELAEERRMLASVLGRLQRWDEAVRHADAAARIEPDAPAARAACIQLRLQAGRVAEAAELARASIDMAVAHAAHAHAWLTALTRAGHTEVAARLASRLDAASMPNDRAAAAVVQALASDNRIGLAISAGEAALRAGLDGTALRSQLGQAYLASGVSDGGHLRALEQLARGVALAPNDMRLMTLYGETLLRAGRYEDAVTHLQSACERCPDLAHTRTLLARALRHCGRHAESADHMLTLASQRPDDERVQRLAIAALSQAGRKDQASELYRKRLDARDRLLPSSFALAMAQVDMRLDEVSIPKERLDWAWSLRREADPATREAWERAARWGHLVDHLLLEWLECRDHLIEEAMTLLDDLDETERRFAPLLAGGKGVVVATAHVGPMYAGLMVLELLGIPSRWVASMPGVATAHYASALISTADQTEAQVARQCFRALQSGFAVCIAVDGAPNPAAPRVPFAGQEITYSSFAARAAHRLGSPSVFYAPRWRNGKIVQTLEMLPAAEPGEDVERYALRWQEAYLGHLREHLAGAPEDLRLSGGLWRHVRPVDPSAHATRAACDRNLSCIN
ncbi:tetratricopeptide repeat protein [Caballeronia sp. M1242]|uniref:tetratricopeptide repeat protein n=1 Tax=Caballeronia sp. M1242 TaxID=2814653 RepID=UPI0019D235D0|nr:tetratricopeptide repeat protein [Caballeronia sp. M1242]QSN64798.1 Vi polysaccharide transport protein VexE [Caballeronia sp. M1242]